MEDQEKKSENQPDEGISLDDDSSSLEQTPEQEASTETTTPPGNLFKKIKASITSRLSLYLPAFVLLIAALIVFTVIIYGHHSPASPNLNQQSLTPTELSNLASGNQVVGNSNEVLTVQSSSIFNGQVLVRGQLQAAASVTANALDVDGNAQVEQLQVTKNLTVAGTTTFQGALTLQNGLSVNGNLSINGSGTFSGALDVAQLTTSTLQLNGDLTINHHINTNGSIPSHSTADAIGSGGTTAINGSDTAGTITINTGGGPSAGCYINVNFAAAFTSTPHVLLTPVGPSSVGLEYYVNRSTSGFSVCSASTPQSAQSYTFDYFVID